MNDPGLDGVVADEAGTVDQSHTVEEREQHEVESSHPHAARWWLASTAYPLAAVCDLARVRGRRGVLTLTREHSGLWLALSVSARCRSHGE